jgi:diguanylate cyclase (GGDEF)-like protein/PAS domain S-box-containing protein
MRRGLAPVRRLPGQIFESLVPVPVVMVLHQAGLAGDAPAVVILIALVVAAITQMPAFHVWAAGGDLQRRLCLRIGIHMAVSTVTIYMLGWGPLLLTGYVVAAIMHIRWTGSRAWRPAVAASLAGVAAGQTLTATGHLFTYLTPTQAQVAGAGGAILVVLLIRRYGLAEAQRERTEDALLRNEQRFRALVQHSSDMITVVDGNGLITYVSPAVEFVLRRGADDLVGSPGIRLIAPEEYERFEDLVAAIDAAPGGVLRTELRIKHADGSARWYEVTLRNLLGSPAIGGVVANKRDVTEQRAAQERLAYEASHDMLTGLDNRSAFMRRLDRVLEGARAQGRAVGVLFIDLDGFKQINDSLGHEGGDTVLTEIAAVLRTTLTGSDVIGRIGGDEFAVVLTGEPALNQATGVARRILDGLEDPFPVHGRVVEVGASIGIAIIEPGASGRTGPVDAGEALRRADLAMYEAKRRRSRRWEIYDESLEPASRLTADDLRTAIAAGHLFMQYQPLVNLRAGGFVGVEGLVRWRHPRRGVVSPNDFVTMAESTGVVHVLGDWVLARACADLRGWRDRVPQARHLLMGVNVSPVQLESERTARRFAEILSAAGVAPSQIVVEVTESALADSPTARANLETLSAAGVRIAIDDFGTGYSSLQYLTRLPIDWLKLDRSFVAQLDGSPEGAAIADAVVRLATTLRLSVTAEGVETPERAAELVSLGYGTAQGFLFGRPMDPERLEAELRRSLGAKGPVPALGS